MALKRTAAPMSGLVHHGANYTWTSERRGRLGLYQLQPGVVQFKEGVAVASAATVVYMSQEEAAELGPILARFGETGQLD